MKMTDECVSRMLAAVQHTLGGNGPSSVALYHADTQEPAVVLFVIPAPVGPLVDKFLNDLYMMLGWHTEQK